MKRLVMMVTMALVVALMMALSGPAWATIHPLANSECANANASAIATEQLPPGITGNSQGSPTNNPTGSTQAQPVFATGGADLCSPAFKTPVVFPEPDYCPADK